MRNAWLHRTIKQRQLLGIACAAVFLGILSIAWKGPNPFAVVIREIALYDGSGAALSLAANPTALRHDATLALAALFLFGGVTSLSLAVWRSAPDEIRASAIELLITLTLSFVLLYALTQMAFEGPWLPLNLLMSHPSQIPIFGHRILFVGVAKCLQGLLPGISNLRSFYLSQWIASVLALYAIGRWSALFVRKPYVWGGQALAVILLILCIDYYVFYDIGTVFFTTCALLAISARRYWLLPPIVLIGTLNYEGTLLLIPLAAFVASRDSRTSWMPAITVTFVSYVVVRAALQHFIPVESHVAWHFWQNLDQPFVTPRQLSLMLFKGAPWLLLGLLSWRYCDVNLKRLTLLFPLNLLTSMLFGQLNELRLFSACIPVLIAMILSSSAKRSETGLLFGRDQPAS